MCSQAALDILSGILDQEAGSLVRYLQEAAQLRPARQGDAEAQAVLEELYSESCLDMCAIAALLGEHVAVFPNVVWEMGYSRFNFLRPVFLIEPVLESTREHIENLVRLTDALCEEGWEEAQQAAERLIERKSAALGRVEALASSLGETESEPPRRNGTSASRW